MKSVKPILVLLIVFVTGIAVGVVGTRYVVRKQLEHAAREGNFFRDRMERELLTGLNLTPEQNAEVKKIFARRWEDFRQLRAEFHPRFSNITVRTEADIKAVLTPEQREQFEEHLKERKSRWRSSGGRPERPPGPPPEWRDKRGPGGGHRERRPATDAVPEPEQPVIEGDSRE